MAERLRELGFALDDTASASTRRPAARTSPTRSCAPRERRTPADEGSTARTSSSPAYLVPGAPGYVGRSRPTVAAGDRRHPRRRRPRRLGAPVLGRRASRSPTLHEFADYGIDGVEAFYATYTEEQTRALHAAARERGLLTTGSAGLPRARA